MTITFRKILLNKCQKEFEKEKKDEMAVHVKMDELTNQGLSVSNVQRLFSVGMHVMPYISNAYMCTTGEICTMQVSL